MKNSFLLIFILCISTNFHSQNKSSIPIDIKNFNKSISDKSLTGLIELSSMEVATSTLAQTLKTEADCQVAQPKNLSDLVGGWTIFFHHLNLESAAKVGIISIGEVQTNMGKEVYVYEQMNYKDVDNCKGGMITYGAGVRLTILAKKLNASADLSSLGAIAAAAEVNMAEVTVSMKTIGLSGPDINAAIPPAGSYNVEKHVQYLQAIDNIKSAVNKGTTVVTPQIISLVLPPVDDLEFIKARYMTFALERIAKKESFNVAKTKLKTYNDLSDTIFRKAYMSFVKATDDTKPSEIQSLQAKEILKLTD